MISKNRILKFFLVIAFIFLILIMLTGCGEEKNLKQEKVLEKSFSVKYDGANIVPGVKFDESKISETANISEIPSCAFEGVDKVYTYPNVEITVADIDGVPTVYSVYFMDETISTGEGVKISDSKELMIEKYGENYENSLENKYDYVDVKNGVTLSFIIENNIITGIEYTLIIK